MRIKRILVGIAEDVKDKIFWVERDSRIHWRSFIPGGVEIVIEYENGNVYGYDWIDIPSKYIQRIYENQRIKNVYAKNILKKSNYRQYKFQLVWNNTQSRELLVNGLKEYDQIPKQEHHKDSSRVVINFKYSTSQIYFHLGTFNEYEIIIPEKYLVAYYYSKSNFQNFITSIIVIDQMKNSTAGHGETNILDFSKIENFNSHDLIYFIHQLVKEGVCLINCKARNGFIDEVLIESYYWSATDFINGEKRILGDDFGFSLFDEEVKIYSWSIS